jgi:transcriptional regulator with XRE-family HTH domain
MDIGARLKDLRDAKNLSQANIEKRTGLLRCYISRVENGHVSPSMETLEKITRALRVPLFHVFYSGEKPPVARTETIPKGWGSTGRDARTLERLRRLLSRMNAREVDLLMTVAQTTVKSWKTKKRPVKRGTL